MNEVWIASTIILWVVVVVIGFLLAGVLRDVALIRLRLGNDPGALITDTGLDRGEVAPLFEAIDVQSGKVFRLAELPRQARVLTFVTPTCASCRELLPHLNEVIHTRDSEFGFLTICKGDRVGCQTLATTYGLKAPLLLDESGQITELYQVSVTPFTYLLDYEGRVMIRGIANDWQQLEALIDQEGTFEAGRAWSSVVTEEA